MTMTRRKAENKRKHSTLDCFYFHRLTITIFILLVYVGYVTSFCRYYTIYNTSLRTAFVKTSTMKISFINRTSENGSRLFSISGGYIKQMLLDAAVILFQVSCWSEISASHEPIRLAFSCADYSVCISMDQRCHKQPAVQCFVGQDFLTIHTSLFGLSKWHDRWTRACSHDLCRSSRSPSYIYTR